MRSMLRPWAIVLVLAGACVSSALAAPLYDWTKTPDKLVEPGYEPNVDPNFESRASLPETLAWIKRTLEQYGTVKGDPHDPGTTKQIVGVAAKDCTLQWEEKRYINAGKYLNDSKYSVRLADLDIGYGRTMVSRGNLHLSTTGSNGIGPQFHIVQESFFVEGTRERSNGGSRTVEEPIAEIALQNKEDIDRRLGHAIVHAARLCGAKAGR
jgi:hypothetical protein